MNPARILSTALLGLPALGLHAGAGPAPPPAGSSAPAAVGSPAPGSELDQEPAPAPESAAEPEFDALHAAWTELLAARVAGGRVDYLGWSEDAAQLAALDGYLAALEAITPERLADQPDDVRLAFWINLYNASVVALVLDNYPLDSITSLDAEDQPVWERPFIGAGAHLPEAAVEGRLSLNSIEHAIVRERFEDARIHAALNCAAESCPPLAAEAFRGEDLDEQLDARMRAFVGNPELNDFNAKRKRLELSQLFEWFAADFERDAGSVRAYVAQYAPLEDTAWIAKAKLGYREYSWKLNAAPKR